VVAEANRELLPYKRITKISLVEQPMEMTSTRKIKRNEVLQKLEDVHE
jgi:long-chain acyl-CoA synthetase